jgi:hypothetical protein
MAVTGEIRLVRKKGPYIIGDRTIKASFDLRVALSSARADRLRKIIKLIHARPNRNVCRKKTASYMKKINKKAPVSA